MGIKTFLIMLIMTDSAALRSGTSALRARYRRRHPDVEKALVVLALRDTSDLYMVGCISNRFAASAVTCAVSQLPTSSERKLSLWATRQPFTVEIALLYVFCLSNSLFFLSLLCLSDRSHMQEEAGSMHSTMHSTIDAGGKAWFCCDQDTHLAHVPRAVMIEMWTAKFRGSLDQAGAA